MNERAVGWCGTLSDRVLGDRAIAFSREDVLAQSKLFAHRAALFYTPTVSIPGKFVSDGCLDITLPIVTPDWTEAIELRTPTTPRFWVDLIQRQTRMIRWHPFPKAKVSYTRYDYYTIRDDHFIAGTKALTDALKEKTSGRADGKHLYYFGAITDDGAAYIQSDFRQITIEHPGHARIRIEVEAI